MTDVSVIVPVFNAARHLERCVEALLAQRYSAGRYEVFMVDNGSTDASRAIIARHRRLVLLSEPRRGAYAARNRGVVASGAPILAFTDADCAPAPDWLERVTAPLRHAEVEVVLGEVRFAGDGGLLGMMAAYETEKAAYVCAGDDRLRYYGYTNNLATLRTVFCRAGPFVEVDRGGDAVFVRRVVDGASCAAVCFAPGAVVRHLEIASAWDYLHKRFTYGRSLERYRRIEPARPLSNVDRLRIFAAAWRHRGYALNDSGLLFGSLAVGGVCYGLGRLVGSIEARHRQRPALQAREVPSREEVSSESRPPDGRRDRA